MLYSIGYGNRSVQQVIELLKKYKVQYLVDVRSNHFSGREEFRANNLSSVLPTYISYVPIPELGGLPKNKHLYTDRKVDYDKLRLTYAYRYGLNRLKDGQKKGLTICLMCSELRPEQCHRSKLIGQDIEVVHIDERGRLVSQTDVIFRIEGDIGKSRGEYL